MLTNEPKPIKIIKNIVRFVVGVALGTYLALLLLTSLPAVQRWTARRGAALLSRTLGTDVRMGNIRLGLFNRVVADDVLLFDQQGDTLLQAARLSAKMDIAALVNAKIRIANVQLMGYDIRLQRHAPNEPYTFQFIVDSLASTDTTTHTPLDLSIRNIIIRRGTVRHDLTWMPRHEGLDFNHAEFHDLYLKASLRTLTDDSINTDISRLSFTESSCGLTVADLDFHFEGGRHNCCIENFILRLPESEVNISSLDAFYSLPAAGTPVAEWLQGVTATTNITASVTPRDIAPLVPQLSQLDMPLQLSADAQLSGGTLSLGNITARADGLVLDAEGDIHLPQPLHARTTVSRLSISEATCHAVLDMLSSGRQPQLSPTLAQTLSRIGVIEATTSATYSKAFVEAEADIRTNIGNVTAHATLADGENMRAELTTTDIRLAHLLDNEGSAPLADMLTLQAEADGNIKRGTIQGTLQANNIIIRGHQINGINLKAELAPTSVKADLNVDDDEFTFNLIADLNSDKNMRLAPDDLSRLRGYVVLNNLHINTKEHNFHLNDFTLHNYTDAAGQHIELNGDFIDAHIDGHFSPSTLVHAAQDIFHAALPSLIPTAIATRHEEPDDEVTFVAQLWNTDPLLSLTDIDLRLPEPGTLRGHLRASDRRMEIHGNFARIDYGSETLTGVSIAAHCSGDSLGLGLNLARQMEDGPVQMALWANARADSLRTILGWDTGRKPAMNGRIDALTAFRRHTNNRIGADISLNPTRINVQDTLWNIHPARISIHDGCIDIRGVEVAQANRHLRVNGKASKNPADTLRAHLQDIPLEYVFDIINFDEVYFTGLATGNVTAHNLMESPVVDADFKVPNLYLNGGLMGHLHMLGGWGRSGPRTIDLDGYITEPDRHLITHVQGLVTPGFRPESGIDLNIFANNTNIYFINDFTSSIFTDLQGRATGYARLFGPFKQLDIEGDLRVDSASLTLDVLGSRYSVVGDSIHLRPGAFIMNDVRVRDRYYGTDGRDHYALLNGAVRHNHFDDITYDFHVQAHDALGYDFRDFGDQTFYGTVFANGDVHVYGQAGALNCDISGHPTAGTVFTYNASSPDAITDNGFITFRSKHDSSLGGEQAGSLEAVNTQAPPSFTGREEDESDEPNDMHINFDLDIGPEATMRLLMDPRSEDYITLAGDGHIRANYYNKGSFTMYGTYSVDHGTYRLSLQDVIRKDFQFERGSSLTFGGQPMKGDLRLKAVYTVPSVSLNDLAVGSNFSNSTVRVNCIMNITGQAEHPQISFDFDIPNVNEDEKQMVRSLIATDEERNLQVIYLLGIGRFYTHDLSSAQGQTTSAVNSLLSTTLTGQLNDLLTNAIGGAAGNWNFGTSLSTGNEGWNSVDVEGMLSGRLLNNRLLINGTFGYRDTPVANTNFIGDFDVQWLLTPSGNVRLKAYSETNDRYFTKSALTTQGIGIQLRKGFNSFADLFNRKIK